MNYKLARLAQDDLIRIHQYGVRKFGEVLADQYFHAFYEKFELIAENPYHYQLTDGIRENYRQCVCGVETIYYRIQDNGVEIMTILGRQNRHKWL